MNNISKTYPFTNENLMSYNDIFDFTGKRVLSVVGSSDQYFSFLLFDSLDVDLFDISEEAINYFYLKYFSIMILSYEEFIEFFVNSKLNDINLYNKVSYYLPINIRKYFDLFVNKGIELSNLIFTVSLNSHPINFSTNRIVPYFDRDAYYRLQGIIRKKELPVIYHSSLENLRTLLSNKYDFMSFSNIYLHMNVSVKKYRDFMNDYLSLLNDNGIIQAYYSWRKDEKLFKSFRSKGFLVNNVPSVRVGLENEIEDYVFVLKK